MQSVWNSEPIVIAGGGIGGLSAALALGLRGVPVRVLEQSAEFGAIGYGIQLGPNVFRMLRLLGIEAEVLDRAYEPSAVSMIDAIDGRSLAFIPTRQAVIAEFGFPYAVILRSQLHDILLAACSRLPNISLEVNATVVDYEEREGGVDVRLAEGTTIAAAAFIGAEGLRSPTRARLHPEGEPNFTGYVAHRTIMPVDELPEGIFREDVVLWAGPGFHVVHYPLKGGELFNVVAVFQTSTHRNRLDYEAQRGEMLEAAKDALPPIRALVGKMDLSRRWTLTDRAPIRHWSDGRVVLLGDAAHPTLQSIAQGACMAIEDAVTLAGQIIDLPGDLATAFRTYSSKRCARTARVQLLSREMWEVFHVADIARDVRNAVYEERSGKDFYTCLNWLWRGVDVAGDGVRGLAPASIYSTGDVAR